MGYGNTTLRTIFPVSVVSPSTPRTARYYNNAEQRTGERILGIDKVRASFFPRSIPTMAKPKYETESAVTLAILANEIPFTERLEAYRLAKDWTAYQKKTAKKFFPKKTLIAATGKTSYVSMPGYAQS